MQASVSVESGGALLYGTEVHMSNTGIAAVFALAEQYHTTTGEVNNLSAKFVSMLFFYDSGLVLTFCSWSVFLLGELAANVLNISHQPNKGGGQGGVVSPR